MSFSVIIGSGIDKSNVKDFIAANAFIVGSSLKRDGSWENCIEEKRVEQMLEAIQSAKAFVM